MPLQLKPPSDLDGHVTVYVHEDCFENLQCVANRSHGHPSERFLLLSLHMFFKSPRIARFRELPLASNGEKIENNGDTLPSNDQIQITVKIPAVKG